MLFKIDLIIHSKIDLFSTEKERNSEKLYQGILGMRSLIRNFILTNEVDGG